MAILSDVYIINTKVYCLAFRERGALMVRAAFSSLVDGGLCGYNKDIGLALVVTETAAACIAAIKANDGCGVVSATATTAGF
jgi:hypothetical protein